MPNWVNNRLEIIGASKEDLDKIYSEVTTDGRIDFNKIIPMPECLNVDSGYPASAAYKIYLMLKHKYKSEYIIKKHFLTDNHELMNDLQYREKCYETGKRYYENKIETGYTEWYSWRHDNWGTKWNAHDADFVYRSETGMAFDTAWSTCEPIIKELSKKYPGIEFECTFHDMDDYMGGNCGQYAYKNGKIVREVCPETDEEIKQFLISEFGYGPEEFDWVDE